MNGGQIAFYTAIATVIPLFLLAYVFTGRELSREMLARGNFSTEDIREAGKWAASPTRRGHPRSTPAKQARFMARLVHTVARRAWWTNVLLFYTQLAVLVPGIAEVVALHQLLANASSTRLASGVAWAGLAASGSLVILPFLYTSVGIERLVRSLTSRAQLRGQAAAAGKSVFQELVELGIVADRSDENADADTTLGLGNEPDVNGGLKPGDVEEHRP
jgi:hypothetical protein